MTFLVFYLYLGGDFGHICNNKYIYIFPKIHYILSTISPPYPPFTLLLPFSLSPDPHLHHFASEKSRPPRDINQKCVICYNKIRHIQSYQGWQGNPVEGKGSHRQAKESEAGPVSLNWSLSIHRLMKFSDLIRKFSLFGEWWLIQKLTNWSKYRE